MNHRNRPEYLARKRQLRDLWIVAGLLMALLPPGSQLAAGLFLSFLSLAYLDERPYLEEVLEC